MRSFMIVSATARTQAPLGDLKSAGRIDVLLHSIISALYASNTYRQDVVLHLLLMGPPNAPRHITITYHPENTISKKDLKKLIEMALKRCRPGETRDVHPGVTVDDKDIEAIIKDNEGKDIFLLDANGTHIKQAMKTMPKHPFFILGDHEGFEKQTRKFLKKNINKLSLGNQVYFTSQAITIINYELDNL